MSELNGKNPAVEAAVKAAMAPPEAYKVEAGKYVHKVIETLFNHATTHQEYLNDLLELRQFVDSQISGITNVALSRPIEKSPILVPR